jgi:Cap4 dsDNA endonuclease
MTLDKTSVFEASPLENGGVKNRQGIEFQDHVAARFCIEMLSDPFCSEVWHEHQDDVTVLREVDGIVTVEYIQVKNTDKPLWSISSITERDKKTNKVTKSREDVIGSSILERSLQYDNKSESALFRFVTSKEVADELKVLKLPKNSSARASGSEKIQDLSLKVQHKLGICKNTNGNDVDFWLKNMLWEVYTSSDLLESSNKELIMKYAEARNFNLKTFECSIVYSEICALVRKAGSTDSIIDDASKKFKREVLIKDVQDLIVSAIIPTNIFEGIGDFEVSWEYLRDVIVEMHNTLASHVNTDGAYNFDYIDLQRKNEINGMTDSFFEHLKNAYDKYFIGIQKFLSLPINQDFQNMYFDLANEINLLIAKYRGSVRDFDSILSQIYTSGLKYQAEALDKKRRYVWFLISYMYFNCDIGKKS